MEKPIITLRPKDGLWTVSFDNSNVFGPQAGQTYPGVLGAKLRAKPYDPSINFGTLANDLLRRFPSATVVQEG